MRTLFEYRPEVATMILATAGTATFLEQANAWVDLLAGAVAVVVGVLAAVWYWQKIKGGDDGDGEGG